MSDRRHLLMATAVGGLIASAVVSVPAAAQSSPSSPAAAQSSPTSQAPSPLERFLALPPDRQEALRNELQPLFFRSMQSNGRLARMAQDCNMPLPAVATPSDRLEADLQSPQSSVGKMFGPARQGALLARLRGALQTSIDCKQAVDLRPDMIKQLQSFPREFETKLEAGLAAGGAASGPGGAHPSASGPMRAAPVPGAAPGSTPATAQNLPRLMIGAPGHCELMTGGEAQPCISGLLYVQSQEGPVLLSVQSSRTVTIGFQGDGDSQPQPEHYTLHLSRMHTSVDGKQASKTVTGTCEISMTTDGKLWQQATCRARDSNGLETVMTFKGDGRPVSPVRPGANTTKPPSPG